MYKMRTGLLVVNTPPIINIGDYIQAIAARQYAGHPDYYIERERLCEWDTDEVKLIMNGWYMVEPQYWPPSPSINPLFVSFHINSLAEKEMLSQESIGYLKKHEPIGCRDLKTMEMLRSRNVDAYFSGCLTLTLGNTYQKKSSDGSIYFVDPYVEVSRSDIRAMIATFLYMLTHILQCAKLFPKFKRYKKRSGMWLVAAAFHRLYSKYFSDDILYNAEFIDHESPQIGKDYPTTESRLKRADELLKKYAKALCIVTSRIHCALPCLAFGTNVIYIERGKQSETSRCRLDGIRELLNMGKVKNGKIIFNFSVRGKISKRNFPINPQKHLSLAKELQKRCLEFVSYD